MALFVSRRLCIVLCVYIRFSILSFFLVLFKIAL